MWQLYYHPPTHPHPQCATQIDCRYHYWECFHFRCWYNKGGWCVAIIANCWLWAIHLQYLLATRLWRWDLAICPWRVPGEASYLRQKVILPLSCIRVHFSCCCQPWWTSWMEMGTPIWKGECNFDDWMLRNNATISKRAAQWKVRVGW